jgi:hypothetical protein
MEGVSLPPATGLVGAAGATWIAEPGAAGGSKGVLGGLLAFSRRPRPRSTAHRIRCLFQLAALAHGPL